MVKIGYQKYVEGKEPDTTFPSLSRDQRLYVSRVTGWYLGRLKELKNARKRGTFKEFCKKYRIEPEELLIEKGRFNKTHFAYI